MKGGIGGILWFWALLSPLASRADSLFEAVPPPLQQLQLASRDNILLPAHLWVNGGGMTVNPALDEVAGLGNVVAPPWTTAGFHLGVTFDGDPVKPGRWVWRPGEMERRGERPAGVEIRTLVSPLFGRRGLIEWIELTNHSAGAQTVEVAIAAAGNFGRLPDEQWTFGAVTRAQQLPSFRAKGDPRGWLRGGEGGDALVVACSLPEAQIVGGAIHGPVQLGAGQERMFAVVVTLGDPSDAAALANETKRHPRAALEANRRAWVQSWNDLSARVPRLTSSNRPLVDFYNRALLSYLVARWSLPELAARPWYATSGLDGGALCAYLWDYSYCSRLNAVATPEADRALIRLFLRTDLTQGYALRPFSAQIFGAHYAYNDYAIIRLIHDYVLLTGDRAFLSEMIEGRTVWQHAYDRAVYRDDLSRPVALIDYGTNYNLLEMKRTEDYTHFVPSPNAERCWSYRAVDAMAGWAGRSDPGLTRRADALEKVISAQLWSPRDRWLCSLDLQGRPHLGYSIQVFDTLRLDVLSPPQRDGLVSHLNEREFLSRDGVHSYSKATAAYDGNARVDWGGPGVYAGDAPELVGDLLHAGYTQQADDVLARILWWGQAMPYYPQAVRADYRGYRRDGRANVIAGATGADTIVFGLLGLRVTIDGAVTVDPHLPSFVSDLAFEGVALRGQRFDVWLDRAGYRLQAKNGKTVEAPYGRATVLR